jgi:hypothetical protein
MDSNTPRKYIRQKSETKNTTQQISEADLLCRILSANQASFMLLCLDIAKAETKHRHRLVNVILIVRALTSVQPSPMQKQTASTPRSEMGAS